MTETERTGGFADAINTLAESFIHAFNDFVHGRIDYSLGNYVHVQHPDLPDFNGHIARRNTSETVLVAREGDGVLVHVTRECIEEGDNG